MKIVRNFLWYLQKDRVFRAMDCWEKGSVYDVLHAAYIKLEPILKELVEAEGGYYFIEKSEFPPLEKIDRCSKIACCFLTLGPKITEEISKLFYQGDYLEGMLLDVMADELIFNLSNQIYNHLSHDAQALGLGLTERIEPGEKHVQLKLQKDILSLFQAEGAALHLSLTEAYMLKPVKSMTYFYGSSKELPLRETDHSCKDCNKAVCKFRDAGKLLWLPQEKREAIC